MAGLFKSANLDKRTIGRLFTSRKESKEMGKRFRQTYHYLSSEGGIKTIRIEGLNSQETDLKFQRFLETLSKPSVTLRAFVERVYRPSFMEGLSPTTKANYDLYLRDDIMPFLGEYKLNEITVAKIQDFYNWMANGSKNGRRKDLAKKSIERIGGFLGRIFKVAVEMKYLEDSPIKKTLLKNNGSHSEHHKPLPDSEIIRVKRLIGSLFDPREKLYMALLAYTGMRREEILGLRWEDIFINESYGEIRQVVIYPKNSFAVVKDHPKTESSRRTFIIPDALKDILKEFVRESGFVLYGSDPETPLSYSTMKRTYTNAFKHLGIEGYNNHDWRSTYGTQLKEAGMTSAQVADLLGHADTRMVETVYAQSRHEGIMKYKNAVNTLASVT